MDSRIIFVRTDKGEKEARSKVGSLSGDARRVLLMVDGNTAFGDIRRRVPDLFIRLDSICTSLEKEGFIQNSAKMSHIPRIVVPTKAATKKQENESLEELDFTGVFRAPTPEMMAAEAARLQAEKLKAEAELKVKAEAEAKVREETERRAREEAEAAILKAQQEAEAVRVKAEQEAARVRREAELAKQRAVAEAKARMEAKHRAYEEAEAARLKAQREAEAARLKAEEEIARVRQEAELARQQAAAEARAREEAERRAHEEAEAAKLKAQQEAEAAKAKAEKEIAKARQEAESARQQAAAEARARKETERRAHEEAEAARLKAQQEVEASRLKVEQEMARVREEAELARLKVQQEAEAAMAEAEARIAKLREEAEQHAQEEAEAARLKMCQEADVAKARIEEEIARAREEAERRAREEAEAARLKVHQEAGAARAKAEEEIARVREEAERLAREEAEASRLKAQQEAEASRIKAEEEITRAREEAERHAQEEAEASRLNTQQEIEAIRLKAEQEIARARHEADLAKQQATEETRAREEMERRAREELDEAKLKMQQELEATKLKLEQRPLRAKPEIASGIRSSSATVLFIDVVGYTRQPVNKQIKIKEQFNQLLATCLKGQGDLKFIILDTGDGAAVGFLQHPEDALEVSMRFRNAVMANQHSDYPDMAVRMGIHLGPVNVLKDVNGKDNIVGDGINDAQRVMSFAGADQIYISRSYYDFISRLNDEYAKLFEYRGSQKDKHDREHTVYELVESAAHAAEAILPDVAEMPAINLEPFNFVIPEESATPTQASEPQVVQQEAPVVEENREIAQTEQAVVATERQPVLPSEMRAKEAATSGEDEVSASAEKTGMPSEEEVQKLAQEQARVWAEAERRAAEAAKASAGLAAQQLADEKEQKAESRKRAPRIRLSGLPWGKLGIGLFVVLLAALFVSPYLLPTQGYASRIEQKLSSQLQQPVHVGQLSARLLPSPHLELADISVGKAREFQVKHAQVSFTFPSLFSAVKPISHLSLEGVQINGTALPQVIEWMQKVSGDTQYPVAHIVLNQGGLEAESIQLSGIGGELDFNQPGKLTQAKLYADGGKLTLNVQLTPENKTKVSFVARGTALPLLPNWHFEDFNASGEFKGDELEITDFDSHILGGILLGKMHVNWQSGWRAEGVLTAKAMSAQGLSKVLSGDLEGSARFKMESPSLGKLAGATALEGGFAVRKGLINGVDIIETVRMRSKQSLPGGRTHFDELSGEFSVENRVYAFRQLKMNAGVLKATGRLNIVNQQLSGNINAGLSMRAGLESVDLQIGGTVDSLSLHAAR